MHKIPASLRKAAVLIGALDERSAEALLAQMDQEQAAQIRSALVELDDIDPSEQERVLAEFIRRQPNPGIESVQNDDVSLELDAELEESTSAKTYSRLPAAATYPEATDKPLAFLETVAPDVLANRLRREQAQTVAVIVSQLGNQQAADVLQRLPAELATDALERMAFVQPLSPEVELDLARELRRQLAPQLHSAAADTGTMGRLAAVLAAMNFRQRQKVVLRLAERNAPLLDRLGISASAEVLPAAQESNVVSFRYTLGHDRQGPAAENAQTTTKSRTGFQFDDLRLLDRASLEAVFSATHPEIVLLALLGAEEALQTRVLKQLPSAASATIRQQLRSPGPVRLRDIELAQQTVAATLERLASAGTIAVAGEKRALNAVK